MDTSVTTLDVSNWNVSNVNSLQGTFYGDSKITALDTSNWHITQPANFYCTFDGLSSIKVLNLSNFTITPSENTLYMFDSLNSLQQFTLGPNVQFSSSNDMRLPDVPTTGGYSGNWQNVGTGTLSNPTGTNVWTSAQLMANYTGGSQADTYVWQQASSMSLGSVSDYTQDPLYTWSGASKPLHSYRYFTVLNNNYSYYSTLTQGQSSSQNVVSLGNKVGATVYDQKTMQVTYTSGPNAGQTATFDYVSFDGNTWYWVDVRALNSDIEYGSISLFNGGIDSNTGQKNLYQLVANSFNQNGQIVYQSEMTVSNFSSEADPAAALATFNANLDAAAQAWNTALGRQVFVKASAGQAVTLKINAGSGDVYLGGNTWIDPTLVKYGNNTQANNPLLSTLIHEMGHALGLDHTGGGEYYNDPYTFSDASDIMWAVMTYEPNSGFLYGNSQVITQNDINAVGLIIANQNFENPQP